MDMILRNLDEGDDGEMQSFEEKNLQGSCQESIPKSIEKSHKQHCAINAPMQIIE
jgi:hypothetical protein